MSIILLEKGEFEKIRVLCLTRASSVYTLRGAELMGMLSWQVVMCDVCHLNKKSGSMLYVPLTCVTL